MNPQNGICLNLLHDKAFDRGLFTIDSDYKIVLSKDILSRSNEDAIQKYFLPYDNMKINLPKRFIPDKSFLEYHRSKIFLG